LIPGLWGKGGNHEKKTSPQESPCSWGVPWVAEMKRGGKPLKEAVNKDSNCLPGLFNPESSLSPTEEELLKKKRQSKGYRNDRGEREDQNPST